MTIQPRTLFQRIGGMTAVNIAVDIFYEKIIADKELKHFFEKIDMKTQSARMKAFLAYAFGAPLPYSGKSMKNAHSSMKISEVHFQLVAGHLSDTLKELSVPDYMQNEVMDIVFSIKGDIVNW